MNAGAFSFNRNNIRKTFWRKPYYDANGQKQGPINDAQLKSLAEQGTITPQTPLETASGHKGKAGQIPGLFVTVPSSFTQTKQESSAPPPAVSAAVVPDSKKSGPEKIGWMSSPDVLKTVAQQGNPEAMFYLGYYSLYGHLHNGKEKAQNKLAERCFIQGAKFAAQGSVAGLCCAGICAELGLDVTKDDLAAVKLYEEAVNKGFAFAYICLAHAYSAGGEFIEKDLKEAAAYSNSAFKQLMLECTDEQEAIELIVLQCNYTVHSGDLGDHLNIESSKCPKEFRKAFEACLEHINKFLEVANQIAELNRQYTIAIDNLNSSVGESAVDGIADAVGGRRWMFDLKGGLADAGISLVTNMVSGAIKTNQAKAAIDANYQNEFYKLDVVRMEIGEKVKESANRVQKIATRYGVVFNCFDSIVEQMTPMQVVEASSGQTAIANAQGTDAQKTGCLVMLGFLGLLATGSGIGCLALLATLFS